MVTQRIERFGLEHIEGDEEPAQALGIGVDVVVELKGQDQHALARLEADDMVVDADGDRRLEGEDQDKTVMEGPPALRAVEVGGAAPAETNDVVRQGKRRAAAPVERACAWAREGGR